MKLPVDKLSKVKQKVILSVNKIVVRVDVSDDRNLSAKESSSNIYCINEVNEILWQVKEIKTNRPFEDDMFVYLGKNDKGEILANRFSGFSYVINPETGEADQIGFHK